MFLRQRWRDDRLANISTSESFPLVYDILRKLWIPDLYILNEKEGHTHDITVPNRLIHLAPDGRILYSQRITVTLSCVMKLEKYPLDNQTCGIQMGSYGFTTKDMVISWMPVNPIQKPDDIKLTEFNWVKTESGDCTEIYTTGTFSCIYVSFSFERELQYYLVQTYVPTLLVVVLSWLSFWIDETAVPARVSLGILNVLTMTSQATAVNQQLPRVSYIKAIDVWMTMCLVFVFGALLEFSVVNMLRRRESARENSGPGTKDLIDFNQLKRPPAAAREDPPTITRQDAPGTLGTGDGTMSSSAVFSNQHSHVTWSKSLPQSRSRPVTATHRPHTIDVFSRVFFPILFLVFIVVYWSVYSMADIV
ncbi:Glycine receptor subunit alpha-2 [Lamellibrachia satsuma]|nr:Glycine receptor subunit alpha-2 [Lamellibrachia satsuma]